ncbi:hypothetical protein NDU88_000378 [Pleurodeles waltl]|uniref:Uncharacterized protein n=1 Tax=Pleurodeles waltl TaxID=8319 RepID=A0AAV7Q0P3_PLEWA|nr:hypothetical protein NDU88_000378 [Pleurodeles waltl]
MQLRGLERQLPTQPFKLMDWGQTRKEMLDDYRRLGKNTNVAYCQRPNAERRKTGAMLAQLLKQQEGWNPVLTLKDWERSLVHSQAAINGVFQEHLPQYTQLVGGKRVT